MALVCRDNEMTALKTWSNFQEMPGKHRMGQRGKIQASSQNHKGKKSTEHKGSKLSDHLFHNWADWQCTQNRNPVKSLLHPNILVPYSTICSLYLNQQTLLSAKLSLSSVSATPLLTRAHRHAAPWRQLPGARNCCLSTSNFFPWTVPSCILAEPQLPALRIKGRVCQVLKGACCLIKITESTC